MVINNQRKKLKGKGEGLVKVRENLKKTFITYRINLSHYQALIKENRFFKTNNMKKNAINSNDSVKSLIFLFFLQPHYLPFIKLSLFLQSHIAAISFIHVKFGFLPFNQMIHPVKHI